MQPSSALSHHEATGDPELYIWIKNQIDYLFDMEPITWVVLLGAGIILVPTLILGFYVFERKRT